MDLNHAKRSLPRVFLVQIHSGTVSSLASVRGTEHSHFAVAVNPDTVAGEGKRGRSALAVRPVVRGKQGIQGVRVHAFDEWFDGLVLGEFGNREHDGRADRRRARPVDLDVVGSVLGVAIQPTGHAVRCVVAVHADQSGVSVTTGPVGCVSCAVSRERYSRGCRPGTLASTTPAAPDRGHVAPLRGG